MEEILVLSILGQHAQEQGQNIVEGGNLQPFLSKNFVAFSNLLRRNIQCLFQLKEYQKQVLINAKTMADEMLKRGYDIVSGGTKNHLFVLDLVKKNISGKLQRK